jgi:hypothetical protein
VDVIAISQTNVDTQLLTADLLKGTRTMHKGAAFLQPPGFDLARQFAWPAQSAMNSMQRHTAPGRVPLRGAAFSMSLLSEADIQGAGDAVEQVGTFAPQVAPLPTVVALSILGVFFALRQRTEKAIKARASRFEAQEALRQATSASLAGDAEGVDLEEQKVRVAALQRAEEELMVIPGTNFRLRLPPAPQEEAEFYAKKALEFSGGDAVRPPPQCLLKN